MKKLIFLIFIFCEIIPTSAQEGATFDGITTEPFDFIVMIDNKLPLSLSIEVSWGKIMEKQILTYSIYYNNKKLFLHNPSILDTLSDTTDIHVHIIFEKAIAPFESEKQIYSFDAKWNLFKRIKIISITNFNKRKNIYYVHLFPEPPLTMGLIWKKEYGNFRKFEKRVFEGIHPLYYSKLGKGKPYPIY